MSSKPLFIGLFLLGAGAVHAQKTDTVLTAVRLEYERIQTLRNLRVVNLDPEAFLAENPDNGASLKGYFRGDTLLKIVEWIGLSDRVRQTEYFLQNGKLLFVYACENRYRVDSSTQSVDHSQLEPGTCTRSYYDHGRLLRQVGDKPSMINYHETLRSYAKLLVAKR